MDSDTQYDVFDGARMVVFSDDKSLVAVWHGGLMVNLYATNDGCNLDAFTLAPETARDACAVQAEAIAFMRAEGAE